MNLAPAETIANAVLYEGYILYPYRSSSVKNRQRWTFGGVYPRAYSEAQRGADAWAMQTECLVEGAAGTRLDIRVRFLQVQERVVGALAAPLTAWPPAGEPPYRPVPALQAGDTVLHSWQEAVAREIVVPEQVLDALIARPQEQTFRFPGSRVAEPVHGPDGGIAGVLVREQRELAGAVAVAAHPVMPELTRLAVRIENRTPWAPPGLETRDREDAVRSALVSTHTLLGADGGRFLSLLDPPAEYQAIAATCRNEGTWPVLVGAPGQRDLLLSSPIILYDYPEIAPESPGDLFDGTEIDEILTLRILALTDAEKAEMRGSDPRGRALLERTESLPAEQLMKLHGTLRGIRSLEDGP